VFAATVVVAYASVRLLDDGGGASAPLASAGQLSWTIEDARQFDEFPLYWLGDSYEGLPLTKVIRYQYEPEPPIPAETAENVVLFIYGSCTPTGEGGCPPPLSIRVEPYCEAPPEIFSPAVRQGTPFEIRDATAEQIAGHLRVWTDDAAITIYAANLAQTEAAQKLRLVDEGAEGSLKPLGPPNAAC
jgi:hypothetical protein